MSRHYYSGVALDSTLSAPLTAASGSGSITVPEAGNDNGWPTSFPFYLAIDAGTLAEEVVEVISKGLLSGSNRTWAVNRGANGQVLSHAANALVRHVLTSMDADDAGTHVNDDGSDFTQHTKMPRGVLARVNTWATRYGPASGAEFVTGSTASAVVQVGRLYRMSLRCNMIRSDGAADLGRVRIRMGVTTAGTVVMDEFYALPSSIPGSVCFFEVYFKGGASTVIQDPATGTTNTLSTIAAGAQSFCWSIEKNSGSGNAATMGLSRVMFGFHDEGAWT